MMESCVRYDTVVLEFHYKYCMWMITSNFYYDGYVNGDGYGYGDGYGTASPNRRVRSTK